MKKHSLLTPFFAYSIRRMTETGIVSIQRKRHIIPEPNCKPFREKGRPLGFENFASLFTFYIIGCIISLIVLVMENTFHPKSALRQDVLPMKSVDEMILSRKIEAFVNVLNSLTDDKTVQLFLWNEAKSKIS